MPNVLRSLLLSATLRLVTPDVSRRRKQRVRVPRLPNDRMQPPPDQHGLHEAALIEFSDDLGYDFRRVWSWWRQVAGAVEFNTGYPRAVCEHYATECVRHTFDSRGRDAD